MGFDFERVYKEIQKEFGDSITFEYNQDEDDEMTLKANVQTSEYDDGIFIKIEVFENGYLINFIFDKVEENIRNYMLINDFNLNVSMFKAFVEEIKGELYLEVACSGFYADEDDAVWIICKMINEIVDDDTAEYLLPLTKRTHE